MEKILHFSSLLIVLLYLHLNIVTSSGVIDEMCDHVDTCAEFYGYYDPPSTPPAFLNSLHDVDKVRYGYGGAKCYCNLDSSNTYWYSEESSCRMQIRRVNKSESYAWAQGRAYAQNWVDCHVPRHDDQCQNLQWATSYCKSIPEDGITTETTNGWGNSFTILPNQYTSPFTVRYAIRCEYPADVAPSCLCPSSEKDGKCSKTIGETEWGGKDYSSCNYCRKLNIMTYRPLGSECEENAECEIGLYCAANGKCRRCSSERACPAKTKSNRLSLWPTCKYGVYNCPFTCVPKVRGECNSNPFEKGEDCCRGMTCSNGQCIFCKMEGKCPDSSSEICDGFFCLNDKITNAEGLACKSKSDCKGGMHCHPDLKVCYRSYDKPITYWYAGVVFVMMVFTAMNIIIGPPKKENAHRAD